MSDEIRRLCNELRSKWRKDPGLSIDDMVQFFKALDFALPTLTPGPWYAHYAVAMADQSDGEYMDMVCITNVSENEFQKTGNPGDKIAFLPHDTTNRLDRNLIQHSWELFRVFKELRDFMSDTLDLQQECEIDGADAALLRAANRMINDIEEPSDELA